MEEKRRSQRYNKQYVIKYELKDQGNKVFDVFQLCDISKGGLKFFSYQDYPAGTKLVLHIRFPFLYPDETLLDGEILGSNEVLKGKTYKIRVKFLNVSVKEAAVLEQMDQFNRKNIQSR